MLSSEEVKILILTRNADKEIEIGIAADGIYYTKYWDCE